MLIRLSATQQQQLLAWEAKINQAHFEEECLPPGCDLVISVFRPVGQYYAEARFEGKILDLGEVEVDFESSSKSEQD